jgi:hypothetical protein
MIPGSIERAGLRHAEANLDGRAAALRESGRGRPCGRNDRGANAGIYVAPGDAIGHEFPPQNSVLVYGTLTGYFLRTSASLHALTAVSPRD